MNRDSTSTTSSLSISHLIKLMPKSHAIHDYWWHLSSRLLHPIKTSVCIKELGAVDLLDIGTVQTSMLLHFTQANKHTDSMGLKITRSILHIICAPYRSELNVQYSPSSWVFLELLGIFTGTWEFSLYFNESFISSPVFNKMQEL